VELRRAHVRGQRTTSRRAHAEIEVLVFGIAALRR